MNYDLAECSALVFVVAVVVVSPVFLLLNRKQQIRPTVKRPDAVYYVNSDLQSNIDELAGLLGSDSNTKSESF